MYDSRTVELPPGPFAKERTFTHGYTGQGDLIFRFETRAPHLLGKDTVHRVNFGFAHGSDVSIVATCIGYYRHLGIDEKRTQGVFTNTAKSLLEEDAENHDKQKMHIGADTWGLNHTATGEGYPRFSHPVHGWKALHYPMVPQPGTIEEKGGTGFYVREGTLGLGHCAMTLVKIAPKWASTKEIKDIESASYDLFTDDIPVFAQVICEQSKGIYSEDIVSLIKNQFLGGTEQD